MARSQSPAPRVRPSKASKNKMQPSSYKAMFDSFDKDGGGTLSQFEIKQMMAELGFKISAAEVDKMIADADSDGDGEVDFDEFCVVMQNAADGNELWRQAGIKAQMMLNIKEATSTVHKLSEAPLRSMHTSVAKHTHPVRADSGEIFQKASVGVRIASVIASLVTIVLISALFIGAVQSVITAPQNLLSPEDKAGTVVLAYIALGCFMVIWHLILFANGQAGIHHWLFGLHVIDRDTCKPVGILMILIRAGVKAPLSGFDFLFLLAKGRTFSDQVLGLDVAAKKGGH